MTLMPEVHDALARVVAARPGTRRWWRPSRRIGLALLAALVVSGSAMASTIGWDPILGDSDRPSPQKARAGIPAEQVAALGVLRRPQTERDRSTSVEEMLRYLSRDVINGVHVDGIRVLRHTADSVTVLIPARRAAPSQHAIRDALCVYRMDTAGEALPIGVGGTCGDTGQLRTRGVGWVTASLVPDGVARVEVRRRGGRYQGATVRDNFYDLGTDAIVPAWPVRWYDAHGNLIEHRKLGPSRP